jgi:hypothetical protein
MVHVMVLKNMSEPDVTMLTVGARLLKAISRKKDCTYT